MISYDRENPSNGTARTVKEFEQQMAAEIAAANARAQRLIDKIRAEDPQKPKTDPR